MTHPMPPEELDLGLYLQRIGYRGPLQPELESLRELHLQHLEAVPYENLEGRSARCRVLEEPALFDTLVREHRGGCGHELNGLFAALLRTLGFPVKYLSARLSSRGGRPDTPEFEHLVLEVAVSEPLESRWLVDVGSEDAFDEPLPLVPGRWPSAGRMFVLETEGEDWLLSREEPEGPPRVLYAFSRVPRRLEDFAERCRQPHAPVLCTRKTSRGRVTLRGDRLILTEGPRRIERWLGPFEDRAQLLLSHFGIPPAMS